MKKKITLAMAAIGLGFGLATTAMTVNACQYQVYCNEVNYMCNIIKDETMCAIFTRECNKC